MITQESEIIEINTTEAYDAKMLASNLSTEKARKRAIIDYLGINCAKQYFASLNVKIDTTRSVYKISFLFEEFKIADLYYKNYRIDVITLFKEKTIKIPKNHVDLDIMPHFYFIVQIGSRIKEAKIIGFIDSKSILNCSHDSKFYYPTLDLIFDIKKFLTVTKRSIPTKTLLGKHVDCLGLFLKFIDNDLSSVYKSQLIQHLMNCDSCRARFIDVMQFENLAKNISHYPVLLKKHEDKEEAENTILQNENYEKNAVNFEKALEKNDTIQNDEIVDLKSKPEELFFDIDEIEKLKQEELKKQNNITNNTPKTVQMFDISEKTDKNKITKKIIDIIFNEIPKMELPALKTIMQTKNRRIILVVTSIIFVLSSFVLISMKSVNDALEEKHQMEEMEEYNSNDYSLEYDLIPNSNNISNSKDYDGYTINQPVSTKPVYSPALTKISWEAPQKLAQRESFAKYLKMTGKNIKLNLQNDLLLINDVPTNRKALTEVILAPDGKVLKTDIYQSSGSVIVDNAIKKVVNDTLKDMKPPVIGGTTEESLILKIDLN